MQFYSNQMILLCCARSKSKASSYLTNWCRATEVATIEFKTNAIALGTGSTIKKRDKGRKISDKLNISDPHLMIDNVDPFVQNIWVSVGVCALDALFLHL